MLFPNQHGNRRFAGIAFARVRFHLDANMTCTSAIGRVDMMRRHRRFSAQNRGISIGRNAYIQWRDIFIA